MKITAHTLVKNEARFIWYAVMSVINHVDRLRIWDMGSSDETAEIIKEIAKTAPAKKLEVFDFKRIGEKGFNEEVLRREMLEATKADWFLILDGDEVWWNDSIKKVTSLIRNQGEECESVVVPTVNLVGDIFHFQEEEAGRYHLAGRQGHYNLRAVKRSIPGLHAKGTHGTFGWVDDRGRMIERRDPDKIAFLEAPYLHATFLERSTQPKGDREVVKRKRKRKYELGIPFPRDYYYPEVFFKSRPEMVASPWRLMGGGYRARALMETPLKKIRRRTYLKFLKHGY